VLDEPTNDLDMETLDVLEDMLADYPGTVLLISHDRDFLDRLVNGVIAPDGNGRWLDYAGGYSDMLAQRGSDLTREQRSSPPKANKRENEPAQPRTEPQATRRRMTFKDKHALETLPTMIAALRAEAVKLQSKLADPQYYTRDRVAFEQTTAALGDVQRKLEAAETQWLELEILREELAAE
jgi:ATP-binding cassette subfamily F protein uup